MLIILSLSATFLAAPPIGDSLQNDFRRLRTMDFTEQTIKNMGGWSAGCGPSYGLLAASNIKFYSPNVACLLRIYQAYDKSCAGPCYILSDTVETRHLYDLLGGPNGFVYDQAAVEQIKAVRKSYLKWAKLVEAVGLEELRRQGISPVSGTRYEWVKTD